MIEFENVADRSCSANLLLGQENHFQKDLVVTDSSKSNRLSKYPLMRLILVQIALEHCQKRCTKFFWYTNISSEYTKF